MTLSPCDQVTERVALGEPLGELTEHAETCASCRNLVAVSNKLGATHHAVDPGLGFSARMTVGAQQRIAVRRRRRMAAGLAATVVAGGFGVLVVAHSPEEARPPIARVEELPPNIRAEQPDSPDQDVQLTPEDDDLAALIRIADVDRNTGLSANWDEIEQPLAPYKNVLKGVTP